MACPGPVKLLRETASLKEVVHALNNFYDEFLEQNIRLNLDHANQEDVNDGEYNKQNATRVSNSFFSKSKGPFIPIINYLGDSLWLCWYRLPRGFGRAESRVPAASGAFGETDLRKR
jgi:hypothetical protein